MKKIKIVNSISVATIITLSTILISFRPSPDKSAAKVRQFQGLYIFSDCTPIAEYQVLGTIQRTGVMSFRSSQYESIRDVLITRAKKEYPDAEGLILDLRDGGTDKADVIRFK